MPDKELLEALNKTLETLSNVDLPNAALILGVFILVAFIVKSIVDWRMVSSRNRGQQQLNQFFVDTFALNAKNQEAERQVNRDAFQQSLEAILERLQSGFDNRSNEHAHQTAAIEELTSRFSQLLTVVDTQLESIQQRFIVSDAQSQDKLEKVSKIGQGLKIDMSEVKNGNQEILNELRAISAEMKKLTELVENAMGNLTNTVDKLTKPNPLTVIKSEAKDTSTDD